MKVSVNKIERKMKMRNKIILIGLLFFLMACDEQTTVSPTMPSYGEVDIIVQYEASDYMDAPHTVEESEFMTLSHNNQIIAIVFNADGSTYDTVTVPLDTIEAKFIIGFDIEKVRFYPKSDTVYRF